MKACIEHLAKLSNELGGEPVYIGTFHADPPYDWLRGKAEEAAKHGGLIQANVLYEDGYIKWDLYFSPNNESNKDNKKISEYIVEMRTGWVVNADRFSFENEQSAFDAIDDIVKDWVNNGAFGQIIGVTRVDCRLFKMTGSAYGIPPNNLDLDGSVEEGVLQYVGAKVVRIGHRNKLA